MLRAILAIVCSQVNYRQAYVLKFNAIIITQKQVASNQQTILFRSVL